MKTAIELADEFPEQNLANIEPDAAYLLNGWGLEAVAMLLQQAEQIDALKADAERYEWLKQRLLCADFSYGDPSEACNALVFEIPEDMRVSACLDSSIDAMKGKS